MIPEHCTGAHLPKWDIIYLILILLSCVCPAVTFQNTEKSHFWIFFLEVVIMPDHLSHWNIFGGNLSPTGWHVLGVCVRMYFDRWTEEFFTYCSSRCINGQFISGFPIYNQGSHFFYPVKFPDFSLTFPWFPKSFPWFFLSFHQDILVKKKHIYSF